jgi:hypothetical protein
MVLSPFRQQKKAAENFGSLETQTKPCSLRGDILKPSEPPRQKQVYPDGKTGGWANGGRRGDGRPGELCARSGTKRLRWDYSWGQQISTRCAATRRGQRSRKGAKVLRVGTVHVVTGLPLQ